MRSVFVITSHVSKNLSPIASAASDLGIFVMRFRFKQKKRFDNDQYRKVDVGSKRTSCIAQEEQYK